MSDPTQQRLPVVVLISGRGSNLKAILDAVAAGKLPIEIRAVISNRPDAPGLEYAREAGIHAIALDHTRYPDRESFDRELARTIDTYHPQLVVLAGYMRILSTFLVEHYLGRMLNIHPSLLPRHPGLNTHQRALDSGDTAHGASVHFVTSELDGGPVVIQAMVPVLKDDTATGLAERVLEQEHNIYCQAILWFAEGRLKYREGHAYLDNQELNEPCQLNIHTGNIERYTS